MLKHPFSRIRHTFDFFRTGIFQPVRVRDSGRGLRSLTSAGVRERGQDGRRDVVPALDRAVRDRGAALRVGRRPGRWRRARRGGALRPGAADRRAHLVDPLRGGRPWLTRRASGSSSSPAGRAPPRPRHRWSTSPTRPRSTGGWPAPADAV